MVVAPPETRPPLNLPAAPPPVPPVKAPPPAQWLRGAGLLALLAYLAGDVADGPPTASIWAYVGGVVIVLWGPEILVSAPDIVRAIFRRQ